MPVTLTQKTDQFLGQVSRPYMSKIGHMYFGWKESETFDSKHFPSGIAFPLKDEFKIDYIWESQDSHWQVELK